MEEAWDRVQRAYELLRAGKNNAAIAELHSALACDPANYEAYAYLSWAEIDKDNTQKAIEYARLAVVHGPDQPLALWALSRAYLQDDRYDQADAVATNGLTIDPNDCDLLYILACCKYHKRQFYFALHIVRYALMQDPNHVPMMCLAASAYHMLGQRREAEEFSTLALKTDPESATAHSFAGFLRLHGSRGKEAEVHLGQALSTDPTDLDAARNMQLARRHQFWPYRAASVFMEATQGSGVILLFVAFIVAGIAALPQAETDRILPPFLKALSVVLFWWILVFAAFSDELLDGIGSLRASSAIILPNVERAAAVGVLLYALTTGGLTLYAYSSYADAGQYLFLLVASFISLMAMRHAGTDRLRAGLTLTVCSLSVLAFLGAFLTARL